MQIVLLEPMERTMLAEINFVLDLKLIAYFLLSFGFGIAFYYIFYSDNSDYELDRWKHDLELKKEWIRMLVKQKKSNQTWPAEWREGA